QNYNHAAETFGESLGMTEEDFKSFKESYSKIVPKLENFETRSEAVELLEKTFNKRELALLVDVSLQRLVNYKEKQLERMLNN
ncbi:MAG: hypothetical protein KDC52_15660, partial [Ignavibacteriae bacterium]|nr:hypothetical protein [Ignavibacteriota bacterium]